MLILTRKPGESVVVGDDVRVVVVEVKGRQVRLGIEAPAATSVHRGEVYERIRGENQRALETGPARAREGVRLFQRRREGGPDAA